MAIDMTPEQKAQGEKNFTAATDALGLNRRGFLKAGILGAGAVGGSAAAVYFGYQSVQGNPVKTALIGAGDEGGVLVGEHNPEFLKFVAVCDIRPSNMTRIYEGDAKVALRKGFKKVYGYGVDQKASTDYIEPFTDYKEMLQKRKDIEAVVIAVPLHLHAPVAIDCMLAGKARGKPIHVLCEKLMAWNVKQCKQMIKVAKETGSILSIGHQRHYSMLYSHATEVIKSGLLGDIKHIRALWHRNFTWPYKHDDKMGKQVPGITPPKIRDGWFPPVLEGDYAALKDTIKQYGYDSVEQLIRWRLHAETGGGLMAELGSHQLDAASIFLGKVKPLAVQGYGGKLFFGPGKNDRNIDDHVFMTYEFPGKDYAKDRNDVVVVSYSSISSNSFEQYGECLMGSRGTMVVEAEQKVMLYTEKNPTAKGDQRSMDVSVGTLKPGGAAADSSSTWGGPSAAVTASSGAAAAPGAPISRGYREEMEDFAYCVRLWDPKQGYEQKDGKYVQRLPRCHGEVAMADAVIALTANKAMHSGPNGTPQRIVFDPQWFDAASDAVPDDPKATPKVEVKLA
ncbi:MAG: Gfo/Idh/MocA family protein [Gemmataceae bacterium]